MGDLQHEIALGIAQQACANTLIELSESNASCTTDTVRGSYAERINIQLRLAQIDFKKWSKRKNISHSQARFTALTMSMGEGKRNFPLFKSKAHNCVQVLH